jgi:16S rRNA (uracil1498-N3)-methyltransferase
MGCDATHIRKVLRLKSGDAICVFDGRGRAFECRIDSISREKVAAVVIEEHPEQPESNVHITLAQAMLKSNKMDTLVRQATELGIDKWAPFISQRSVSRPEGARIEAKKKRWARIMEASLKQCRRNRAMEICHPVSWETLLAQGKSSDLKIVFYENESKPLSVTSKNYSDIIIVLGPEGGFSEAEIDLARNYGYDTLSMGPRILRAETASLSACVLIQYLFGDMGRP